MFGFRQRAGIADQGDALARQIREDFGLRHREALQRGLVAQGAGDQKAKAGHASSFR